MVKHEMDSKYGFQVHIKGPGADPEGIGAGDLGDILRRLEAAIAIAATGRESRISEESTEPIISLLDIRKYKSIDLKFSSRADSLHGISAITEAIATHNYSIIPEGAQEEISCISRFVAREGWSFEFQENKDLNIKKAEISIENPVPEPSNVTVEGRTILWGYLIRVGGGRPKAVVRLSDDTPLTIKVSKKLAKELGNRLYEDVGIDGVATWRTRDWKLLAFEGKRLTEYNPQNNDLVKSFEELAKASQGRWEHVDPIEYVKKMRDED